MPPPIDPNAKLHEVLPDQPQPANDPRPELRGEAATSPGAPWAAAAAPPAGAGKKRRVLWAAAAVGVALAGTLGVRAWLTRGEVSTDDAQIEADVVALSPRVAGPVAEVLVADDAHVAAGVSSGRTSCSLLLGSVGGDMCGFTPSRRGPSAKDHASL